MDNIKEWSIFLPTPELLARASCRKDWKRISAESSVMSPPTTQSVKGGIKLNRKESKIRKEKIRKTAYSIHKDPIACIWRFHYRIWDRNVST